ncbi:hypothetical protein HY375_00620 [Candidatus Berkelbacteria bacterium]|nr:hypothetical protein [Candidatus Berkelbacteria bacterium]
MQATRQGSYPIFEQVLEEWVEDRAEERGFDVDQVGTESQAYLAEQVARGAESLYSVWSGGDDVVLLVECQAYAAVVLWRLDPNGGLEDPSPEYISTICGLFSETVLEGLLVAQPRDRE